MNCQTRIFFGFLLVILCAGPALAQADRASVTGVVTDPQGKPVPDAKVTVKNAETGASFETTTAKDTGRYVTPAILKPGRYTVEVVKEGFKAAVSQVITLEIGDVKEVDLALEVGAVSQTVRVEAKAPLLETETSELGEVVTGRQITDLPLKDRNFTQLAALTPGVVHATVGVLTDATAFNQGDARFGQGDVTGASNSQGSTEASRFSRSGGASISVNGLRPTNNNFSLDGVDNNEPQFGTIGVYPNPDAIQEFKVETGNFKAENGRGGAIINTTYQSGTNALHGSLYYYGQNDYLNATAWEIGRLRNDLVATGVTPQQAKQQIPQSRLRVNEFGFTLGGPLIKDKTFFFGDFLGQRNATPNAFETVVPTAKSRTGDFSEFTSPVINPQTCTVPGNIASGGCSNFPGNVIPNLQSRSDFSPQAFKLFALYPLPIVNVTDPNNSTGHFNFFGTRNNTERINAFDVKIDHKLTNSNSLFGRYSQNNQERDRANFFPKVPTAGFGAGNDVGNTRQVVVEDTHVFKPTLLNDLRFGWTRVEIGILNCGVEGTCGISPTTCQDLGIPNCNHGTPATTGGILSGGFGTGFFEFTGDGGLFLVKSNNFYVGDSVTIISGHHTWKAGFEVRPRLLDTIDGGRSGGLKGQLQYGAGQPQSTGNVQADYLLSRPAIFASNGAIAGGDNPFQLRTAEWGMFLQDDWKASTNLTLNLGIRYDLFPPWREASGRMADFNPRTGQIIIAKGSGDRIISTATHNVGPRVGFAYNFGPQKKMVLRGGYGIFYSEDGYDYPPVIRNPPLTASSSGNGGGFFGGTSAFNLTTGPPCAKDFSVPTPSCPAVTIGSPPVVTPSTNLFSQELNQRVGMIQEFNLTGEWEFARDWLFDLGYAGSRSHHLLATRDLGNNGVGLGFAKDPTGAPIGTDIAYENRANANYDSMQASMLKRFSRGFLFRGSYTWSHNIDDSTGVFQGLGESRGTSGGPADPLNFRLDRATSSLDRRQVFVANLIWDLPIGKGKWLAANVGNTLDKFIGGWQFNSIWSAQTGQPFDVTVGSNNDPTGAVRPNVICNPLQGRSGATADSFFNASCFQVPQFVNQTCGGQMVHVGAAAPAGSVRNLSGLVDPCGNVGSLIVFGNLGRNAFVGPGLFRADLSLFKNTQFGERYRLQIGIDLFNAFNNVNLVVPNNTLTNGDFNRFDSSYPPRQIQYRMKLIF